MSLERYLSAKSRDRHSEFNYDDDDVEMSQDDEALSVKQLEARKATVVVESRQSQSKRSTASIHPDMLDAVDSEADEFQHRDMNELSVPIWRRVIPVLGKMFKKVHLKTSSISVAIYRDEFTMQQVKSYLLNDQLCCEETTLNDKDGRFGLTICGDVYATEQFADRAHIIRVVNRLRNVKSQWNSSQRPSVSSIRPSVIEKNMLVDDEQKRAKNTPEVKRKSVLSLRYNDQNHALADKVAVSQISTEKSLSQEPSNIFVAGNAGIGKILDELELLRSQVNVMHAMIDRPVASSHVADSSFYDLVKAVDLKVDFIQTSQTSQKQEKTQKLDELLQLMKSIMLETQHAQNPDPQITASLLKPDFDAISNSLTKIIEYLSRSVDIQNIADTSFHKKFDILIKAADGQKPLKQSDPVTSQLRKIEQELVNVTRTVQAQKMRPSVEVTDNHSKELRAEISQLLAVVNSVKGKVDRDNDDTKTTAVLQRVDDINMQLSQYLVATRNESADMSALASNVTSVMKTVQQLQAEVSGIRQELRTPSPVKELQLPRASTGSPTKSINAGDSIAIVSHILDLNKSIGILRNQVSDLALHQNTSQQNLGRLLTDVLGKNQTQSMQQGLTRQDLEEFKLLLKGTLDAVSQSRLQSSNNFDAKIIADQTNVKYTEIMSELEHLQYGFQNQMTAFRKTLQSVANPAGQVDVDQLKTQVEQLTMEKSKLLVEYETLKVQKM